MTGIDPQSFLSDFLDEAGELTDTIEEGLLRLAETAPDRRPTVKESILRDLHTLKGNSGMIGLQTLQKLAHRLEDAVAAVDPESPETDPLLTRLDEVRALLEQARRTGVAAIGGDPARGGEEREGADRADPAGSDATLAGKAGARLSNTVRIPFSSLDALVDRLMEVVIFRNRLADGVARGLRSSDTPDARRAWREVSQVETALAKILDQLRAEIMALRMVPLTGVLDRLRRLAHDESKRAGKRVDLRVSGGDTPVDKALLELASEALGHLVRNAVVHGIEDPEVRKEKGKPATGRVEVAAEIRSEELVIRVRDDGAGIDLEALRQRATAQGIPQDAQSTGAQDLYDVIFLPGVSSQLGADIGAGRGMGLAAVEKAVKRQGGRIEVSSQRARGTRFELFLPLVVSITNALLVEADGEHYALPVTSAVETLALLADQRHEIRDIGVLRWRGNTLPLLDLGVQFGTSSTARRQGHVVIVEVGGRYRGLVVDQLLGLREIVVKSLDSLVGQPRGILGSTVLGDGRAVLILDPPALLEIPVTRARTA